MLQDKDNEEEAVARLGNLFSGSGGDCVCAFLKRESPALRKFAETHPGGETVYPDPEERLAFWSEYLAEDRELEDDSLPCAYLSEFDEGLYAGLLGGEVRFLNMSEMGWVSSMAVPKFAGKPVEDLLSLRMPEDDHFWMKRYLHQLRAFRRGAEDRFGVSHLIVCDAVNLLYELRGATQTYWDLADDFDICRKVMDFSTELCQKVQDLYFEEIGLYRGGTFSNLCGWLPGKVIAESMDPYHLSGPAPFYEYGKEYIERMFSHYDGGIVHIHANAYFLVRQAAELQGIRAISLLDDPYNPPAYLQLERITADRGSVPLTVNVPYEWFVDRLKKKALIRNILYVVEGVPGFSEANALMKQVKRI